jgi:hypothetical protein
MLFMVIEHFKDGNPNPIGERFRHSGRMLPQGVLYHASWIDPAAARCFQVMEALDPELSIYGSADGKTWSISKLYQC